MTTQTVQCKAKNGWQSCRYHGSGFSHFRVATVTTPLKERSHARYLKILRATLLDPTPTNDVREGYVEKAKEAAGIYQLLHDATPEGSAELDSLIADARAERNSDYVDMFYARKYNAERFNELLDVEERQVEKLRQTAEDATLQKFGSLTTPEAKQYRDKVYNEAVTDLYKNNPRIKSVDVNNLDVDWDTRIANKALLECVSETLRRVR